MCNTLYRDWQLLAVTGDNNIVTPDTLVLFLVSNYSFVFVVDMSPSMAAVVCLVADHCCTRIFMYFVNLYAVWYYNI